MNLIGSHNTMSYLKVAHWWLRPLRITARCQHKNLIDQLANPIIDVLDLRVRFSNRLHKWVFCHGLIDFDSSVGVGAVAEYIHCRRGNRAVIRLLLERGTSSLDMNRFEQLCRQLEEEYPEITFIGGRTKKGWHLVYDFKGNARFRDADISQPVSSMSEQARWYERILPIAFFRRIGHLPASAPITLYDFV